MSTSSPARPAARYGDRRTASRRPVLIAAAGAAVLLAIALAGWAAVEQALRPVTWSLAGVTIVSDAETDVSYTITTRPGRVVDCLVEALTTDQTVVGLVDVRVGPSTGSSFTVTTKVPTTERPDGGQIKACAAT